MEKVRYQKSDKVLYQGVMPNKLKVIVAPMPDASQALLCVYLGVGGYARSYTIGNQRIYPGTAGMVALALLKNHSEKSDSLFKTPDVSLTYEVEESYVTFKVSCPKEKAASLVEPLLSLFDDFNCTNDQAENQKKEYLPRAQEEQKSLVNKIRGALYLSSPMKYSPYGTEDDIRLVHLVAMKKFFNAFCGPENLTLFAVGQVKPEEISPVASAHLFPAHQKSEEVNGKDQKEDPLQVADRHPSWGNQGELVLAVKFPARKDLFDQYGDDMFSYYNMIYPVLFSPANRCSSHVLSDIEAFLDGGIRQGGEEAFFYQAFKTADPEKLKKDLEAFFSLPKQVSFWDFRSVKKSFLLSMQKIYKNDPAAYYHRLAESFANSYADPSVTDSSCKLSRSKTQRFLTAFGKYARIYISR
jgi:hypothetical protein